MYLIHRNTCLAEVISFYALPANRAKTEHFQRNLRRKFCRQQAQVPLAYSSLTLSLGDDVSSDDAWALALLKRKKCSHVGMFENYFMNQLKDYETAKTL